MSNKRTELQREVVEALVSSKAINFEAAAGVLSKYGARAATTGDAIGLVILPRVIDLCIPVDWQGVVHGFSVEPTVATKAKG